MSEAEIQKAAFFMQVMPFFQIPEFRAKFLAFHERGMFESDFLSSLPIINWVLFLRADNMSEASDEVLAAVDSFLWYLELLITQKDIPPQFVAVWLSELAKKV